jgi:multiple sugar transport system ATP-binding protein
MRAELSRLHDRLEVTTVYVTHDQVEAMTLGQRVAVMRDGRIQQVDTPQVLYSEPANLFVAAFIGSPAMNLVEAELVDGRAEFGGFSIPLDEDRRPTGTGHGRVILGIRPEDFEDASLSSPTLPRLQVEAAVVEDLGAEVLLFFPVDAPRIEAEDVRATTDEEEEEAALIGDDRALFTARIDPHTKARNHEQVELTVNPSRLHFFDPETGATIGRSALAAGVTA